ncbi:protein PFC0760c [Ostrinia furnacalis]|uniref:protein PFC0760c n=1 Tax=Ostrinia furnacalis TaxID=93504 RepID=UPI00103AB8D2|nr:protein PFC0760c [Ostrinia furnacalis]
MEVGAVKQAFNNELILLKKKLNQAKIQIIHKLTRKSKTLVEKKAPENLKEKLKRKATAAVNEVLIIKKIKPKDLAKFIITHKGELNSYLNKPNVDQDKACARLLLHKSLQDKYKFIKSRFSSVPIDDLLMSREERKKMKKEAKEKQKNKKKGKGAKVVNAEGEWDVEDIEMTGNLNTDKNLSDDDDDDAEKDDCMDEDDGDEPRENISDDDKSAEKEESSDDEEMDQNSESENESNDENGKESDSESKIGEYSESDDETPSSTGKLAKAVTADTKKVNPKTPSIVSDVKTQLDVKPKPLELNKKLDNKKDKHKQGKNKNLNEKLLSRKFKKDVSESPVPENKVVDPFFITSTGENYMSVVEPRPPDEVKEVHKQGNRKIRRAAMFGHVPKIKPRNDNFAPDNRFNKQNGFNKNSTNKYDQDSFGKFKNDSRKFTDKRSNFDRNEEPKQIESKPEKLHPSWEAKKRQSGIKPFQGKKIVFDES